ncbi:hypothetical protein [Rhizobium sp. L1K21]|uniref:hypothetical protein n=1 Tax=Rhizobium sp. L1K21 TaxID=2954933 RepID=UPI002092E2A1|nr:hypothetical protein [Rhizobium sp. L1K21]MCO6184595.1 hypothetical protein [Rhizobium sp. L1K21]
MKVSIVEFGLDLAVKNSGMALSVYSPDGKTYLGRCKVTKTGLEWYKGKKQTGAKMKWEKFIEIMEAD